MIFRLLLLLILAGSLQAKMHHLRGTPNREWSSFPKKDEGATLEKRFQGKASTLRLRQQDVKQLWEVKLNGTPIGRLTQDENDMIVYFSLPANLLKDTNVVRIERGKRNKSTPDDIRVGDFAWLTDSVENVTNQSTVTLHVTDSKKRSIPSRITVLHESGAMQSVGAKSNDHLAVRPGTVYTSTGKATFGLPAGRYKIYAGRGFEWSLASTSLDVKAGDSIKKSLQIKREVPTQGYVACDTHVHTLTHSGHGDSTVHERMITLAAEGIELPIATDHNVHIDHESFARKMKVRQYFTPVIGNEVTTKTAHFNIFPVKKGAKVPDYKNRDWRLTFDSIARTPNVKVVILNHARDLHSGTRPFGPKLHLSLVGRNLEGWKQRANAMEVVNSAAIQTDVLQLFHDWMGMLNRGHRMTPVGSSDSHDVARHFVGQGRTYIRCRDGDPGKIDVEEAVNSFVQGRVMVSYGLAVDLKVENRFGPGEVAAVPNEKVKVSATVLGPHWVNADRVMLFANGVKIRETRLLLNERLPKGLKGIVEWKLDRPKHDVHLVAIAQGPGVDGLYWKTAKPYQPDSPDWTASVLGCSGAVWLDADQDGRCSSAFDYAQRFILKSKGDIATLLNLLKDVDEAIILQVADVLQLSERSLLSPTNQKLLKASSPRIQKAVERYRQAWRASEIARSK